MCGGDLPIPGWESVKWTVDETYKRFTGAMAIPACCKVWITWRSTDETWRYEIRDHHRWSYRGDKNVEQLNNRVLGVTKGSGTNDIITIGLKKNYDF